MPKRKIDNNFVPSDSSDTSDDSSGTEESLASPPPPSENESNIEENLDEARTEYYLGSNDKRVSVQIFNGSVRVDIRSYFRDKDGKWKPTQKGVSLLASEFNDLVNDSDEIQRAVKRLNRDKSIKT